MTNSRAARAFVEFIFSGTLCCLANGQNINLPRTGNQQVLSLNVANNGQLIRTTAGQQIDITLGMVGPAQYGTPLVTTPAVRLESTALRWPPNPGGPTFVYIFEAAQVGEAQVIVPVLNSPDPEIARGKAFAVTIRVGPASGKSRISKRPDQANTAKAASAWTNLLNNVQQTFTPALPVLTSVEVELVVANPGASEDEITLTLLNPSGEALAVVSKIVSAEDCNHVRFVFPNGGWPVSAGQTYAIQLRGGSLFGWKYVVGGYQNGAASMNGKALVADTRASFLFRTFGAD